MLWEFISTPCISNIQGLTMVILILQAPSPLHPPAAPKAPQAAREAWGPRQGAVPSGVPSGARAPTAAARGLTLGITGAKGAGLQSRKDKCWKQSLCGGCHCQGWFGASSRYHGLTAFAGDWARGEIEGKWGQADLPTSNVQRGFYHSLEVTQSKHLPPVDGTLPI